MIHKIRGTIINIGEQIEVGTTEKYPKTNIIIESETGGNFCLTFLGFEQNQFVPALNIGDYGTFLFNMKTKEYNGKRYNSLTIFRFKIKKKANEIVENKEEIDNDLPF